LNVIQAAANNRLSVVPSIPQWYINQFDYNKDIRYSGSNNNGDAQVLSWSPVAAAYGANSIRVSWNKRFKLISSSIFLSLKVDKGDW